MKTETIRAIRTALQVIIPLLISAPLVLDQLGVDKSTGVIAGVTVVSAGLARLMAVPAIDQLVNRLLGMDPVTQAVDSQGK